jgi:hypothetical protein
LRIAPANWFGQHANMIILSIISAALLLTNANPVPVTTGAETATVLDNSAPSDPIAAAASGLIAQIEDDANPGGDLRLVSMKSDGCTTVITGTLPAGTSEIAAMRSWTINWAVPGSVAPGDTFIFIDVAPVKIALVGNASDPDQAAKLSALFAAMFETQLDCTTQF